MFSRKDRFLHPEPNKIGFAFFDFSTIFNEFSKMLQKTLKHFYRGASKYFLEITQRSLDYGNLPGKNREEAMWSLGGTVHRRRRN
jgi:hypothetical protein